MLVETNALLSRRFGVESVRSFRADVAPLVEVVWIDEPLHNAGLDLLLARGKRAPSLVDAVSFISMETRIDGGLRLRAALPAGGILTRRLTGSPTPPEMPVAGPGARRA